jgi:hypothetical protein
MKKLKTLNKELIEFENSEIILIPSSRLPEIFPDIFETNRILYKSLYNELYEFECENVRYKIKSCANDHVVWEKNYYKEI